MDTLRLAAGEPLTAEEITIRIMTMKGLDAPTIAADNATFGEPEVRFSASARRS